MSNYNSLKATINANIKTNGNQEITGSVLNSVLNAMVNTLGAGYQYAGIATPSTNPGTPDSRVFYLAATPGTYTNFAGISIGDGEVGILKYDSSWNKDLTGLTTAAQAAALDGKIVRMASILYPVQPSRTYTGYRIPNPNDNRQIAVNASTDVLWFNVGANKKVRIVGSCGVPSTIFAIGTGVNANVIKVADISTGGDVDYVGETTETHTFVGVTINTGSAYTFGILETLQEYAEKTDQNIADLDQLVNDSINFQESVEIDRTYNNYVIGSAADNRIMVVNQGTNVYFFLVGAGQKFRVKGTCSHTGCTICAIAGSVIGDVTKLTPTTGGEYDITGETTESQPYVMITTDAGTEFSCSRVKPVIEKVDELAEVVEDVRPVVNILTTDTEVEIFNKLLSAYETGNIDVVWQNGVYTFAEIYQYMLSIGWSWTMELPIGNNCRYYFNGSTIISNPPSGEYTESRNIFGCKAGSSNKMSFELHDGVLINNGGTYCVHDECARGTTPYLHKYVNMRMYYNKIEGLTDTISKCIGGGCGLNGLVVIEDCVFVSDATNVEVSWHGKQNETNNISFNIFVNGCYFGRGMAISSHFKSTDKVFVKYSNNSSRDSLNLDSTPDSELIAFNNEIHQ